MNKNITCFNKHHIQNHGQHRHRRKGPSSFGMFDSEQAFEYLKLQEGDTFLDLGCGAGDYSLYAAGIIGKTGTVYAIDLWDEMLKGINKEAGRLGINNIHTITADICNPINIADNSIDVCLLATVMHAEKKTEKCKTLFTEIVRVLKPNGRLAIIECKKEEILFGPPLSIRISPEELENVLKKYGFKKMDYVDLGYYYMILFSCNKCLNRLK